MERTPNHKKAYTTPTLKVVEFKVEKGFAESQGSGVTPAYRPESIILGNSTNSLESYNMTNNDGSTKYFEW